MRRWGHTHSIATGGIVALALVAHLWLALALTFAAGVLVGWFARQIRHGARKVGKGVDAQTRLQVERWKEVRSRRAAQVEKRRSSRALVDAAYKRGYVDGKLDG